MGFLFMISAAGAVALIFRKLTATRTISAHSNGDDPVVRVLC